MTNPTRCFSCQGSLQLVREPVDFEVGRRVARVEVERYKCADCGEAFYSPDQAEAALRAASDQIRKQEDLLSPDAIKKIRVYHDLTQAEFERVLGVGPKTAVRWERGTVFQNRATDRLLRVLAAVPAAFEFLAQESGVHPAKAPAASGCVVPFKPKNVRVSIEPEPEMPAITKEALK